MNKCFSAPAQSEVCTAASGNSLSPKSCPDFCCGTCYSQYCCSDVHKKFVWSQEMCRDLADRRVHTAVTGLASTREHPERLEQQPSSLRFSSYMDNDLIPG